MQTLHLTGINKLLHPERDKRSATERIFDHLSHSNLGLNRGEATADTGSAASALDSFSVTQNISEFFSPACGHERGRESLPCQNHCEIKRAAKAYLRRDAFCRRKIHSYTSRQLVSRQCVAPFESGLAHSTSKEEAQSVYLDTLTHISEDDPMKEYIIAAYDDDAWKEFQKSDQYQSLPETKEDAAKQHTGSRHSHS